MCKEDTAAADTTERHKSRAAGCPCGSGNCDVHRCLPILGLLVLAVAIPLVAKKVKTSREA